MCNKIVFQTKKDARFYVKILCVSVKFKSRSYRWEAKNLAPYACTACGLWHLTSKKKVKTNKTNAHYKRVARK